MKALYTAVATATDGGRNGRTRTDDGKIDVQLSMPRSLGGPGGDGSNPEQLFAAGYAACFANAMRRVAHAMFGLRPPADAPAAGAGFRPGATVRMLHGGIAFALVPRQLEAPPPLGGLPA